MYLRCIDRHRCRLPGRGLSTCGERVHVKAIQLAQRKPEFVCVRRGRRRGHVGGWRRPARRGQAEVVEDISDIKVTLHAAVRSGGRRALNPALPAGPLAWPAACFAWPATPHRTKRSLSHPPRHNASLRSPAGSSAPSVSLALSRDTAANTANLEQQQQGHAASEPGAGRPYRRAPVAAPTVRGCVRCDGRIAGEFGIRNWVRNQKSKKNAHPCEPYRNIPGSAG